MTTKKQVDEMRAVAADQELIEGVFHIGSRYCITTPTWIYIGTLRGVTPMVYIFSDTETVYETGPWKDLFAGKPQSSQKHDGAAEMLVDRAGCTLQRFAK